MTLDEFLRKAGRGSAKRLAKKIGVPESNISMWRNGKQQPSPRKCKQIETETLGAVKKEELRPDVFI